MTLWTWFAVALAAPVPVVGGAPAAEGSWPDVAAIEYPWGVACTGTLIAADVVLTAGHCAVGAQRVILNTVDFETGGETLDVDEIIEYPNSQRSFDVAVLILAEPSTVKPRELALDCLVDERIVDGAETAIVGYGATDVDAELYGSILMEAAAPIVDADCSDIERGCEPSVAPAGELIAGGDGIDSCNGDSGGPLYGLGGENEAWLIGVTSRGSSPAEALCGDGGIYVRVDAVAEWIEEVTNRILPRPTCIGYNHAPDPTVSSIEVPAGETAQTTVVPNDIDVGDSHEYTVISTPTGAASIASNGIVTYTATADHRGPDNFVIKVTDNGDPPRSGTVTLAVNVVEPLPDTDVPADTDVEPRCGCSATAGAPWWLFGATLLLRRRRL